MKVAVNRCHVELCRVTSLDDRGQHAVVGVMLQRYQASGTIWEDDEVAGMLPASGAMKRLPVKGDAGPGIRPVQLRSGMIYNGGSQIWCLARMAASQAGSETKDVVPSMVKVASPILWKSATASSPELCRHRY